MSDPETKRPAKQAHNAAADKPAVTVPAIVEKIVKPVTPTEPEKAQITIEGGEDLYREIRIENTLETPEGEKVKLRPGAQVDVTIEAPPESVEKKKKG